MLYYPVSTPSAFQYNDGNSINSTPAGLTSVGNRAFGSVSVTDLNNAFGQTLDLSNGRPDMEIVTGGADPYLGAQYRWISGGTASMQFASTLDAGALEGWVIYDWYFDKDNDGNDFGFNGTSGTQWSHGGKMPGMYGGDINNASGGNNATSGFSSRFMWQENGGIIVYIYYPDKPGTYGQAIKLQQEYGVNSADYVAPVNQWIRICKKMTINSNLATSDGSLDVWIDHFDGNGPVKRLEVNGVRWRSTNIFLDHFFYSTFYGGGDDEWHPGSFSGDKTQNTRFKNLQASVSTAGGYQNMPFTP